jgi:hypothetical protein
VLGWIIDPGWLSRFISLEGLYAMRAALKDKLPSCIILIRGGLQTPDSINIESSPNWSRSRQL